MLIIPSQSVALAGSCQVCLAEQSGQAGTKSSAALMLVISPQGLIWHFCNRFFIGYWINNGALFLFSPPSFITSCDYGKRGARLAGKNLLHLQKEKLVLPQQ